MNRYRDPRLDDLAEQGRERERRLSREQRRTRGVVHTPVEIARFVAALAEAHLVDHLGLAGGLASPQLRIVDPAVGPGIFLGAILERAGQRGAPREVLALDVDSDVIARTERQVGQWAREVGWPIRFFAANSLEARVPWESESGPCLVIGNPPWAARSANREVQFIEHLMQDFRRDAGGQPLRERKIGVLSDDYVRFVRWALEVVDSSGGVLALVTNGSYLDGPVHRGMRARLARSLPAIELVDLGGSSLIAGERGLRDENVFGVKPNVAILVGSTRTSTPKLQVVALRGRCATKLSALSDSHGELTRLGVPTPLTQHASWLSNEGLIARYLDWPSVADWMPFHREGLQTNRDDLVVSTERCIVLSRLARFADGSPVLEKAHWDSIRARAAARSIVDGSHEWIRRIAYRPFDVRWAVVHPALCHRPRKPLIDALDESEFCLITTRKDRGRERWNHFGTAAAPVDNCWLSARSSCRSRVFPLVKPDGTPNLDPERAGELEQATGMAVSPGDLAAWALRWMASSAYQARFDAALRLDYPRVPSPATSLEWKSGVHDARAVIAEMESVTQYLARIPGIDAESSRGISLRWKRDGDSWRQDGDVVSGPPELLEWRIGHHPVVASCFKARPTLNRVQASELFERLDALRRRVVAMGERTAVALAERMGGAT